MLQPALELSSIGPIQRCPFGPKVAHAAFVHCRYILDSPTLHRALGDQRSFMQKSVLSKDWVQVSATGLTGWHAVVVCP